MACRSFIKPLLGKHAVRCRQMLHLILALLKLVLKHGRRVDCDLAGFITEEVQVFEELLALI
jgi:hypothetical protein